MLSRPPPHEGKTLIIGLQNPYSDFPALYPVHSNCSGWKLWQISGLSLEQYLSYFTFANLFTPDAPISSSPAAPLVRAYRASLQTNAPVVLLGNVVRKMLGVPKPLHGYGPIFFNGVVYYIIPHPSGRNHKYNNPVIRHRVRHLLRELGWHRRGDRG